MLEEINAILQAAVKFPFFRMSLFDAKFFTASRKWSRLKCK